MIITFSPQRRDDDLALAVAGGALTINGQSLELSAYDAAQPHAMIVGQPALVGGEWQVTVILPIGQEASEAQRFPDPVTVEADGPVALP